jgi:hypothetical protein
VAIINFLSIVNEFPSSIALRESTWMYPIVESVHSVGIALFVGLLLLWDLRLVGYGLVHMPVSRVWTKLFPWIVLGTLIMLSTGLALFYAKPLYFWGNVYFRVKLLTLFLAGLNAAAFHLGIEKKMANWDTAPTPPVAARFAGASSILLWAGVIVFGRFIAYNWYPQLF